MLVERLNTVQNKISTDSEFIEAIERDPVAALAGLGFNAESAKKFRIIAGVDTRDSCSCACFPVSCGTGVGCMTNPGSSAYSCD